MQILEKLKKHALVWAYVLVFFGGTYHAINFVVPLNPPMREFQNRYEMEIGASIYPPFFYKYYVFKPKGYDESKKYPLLLLLHGGSRHMKDTGYITGENFQYEEPAFIIVPIAPPRLDWGSAGAGFISALPLAISSVKATTRKYNIDERRIYVSGYSMGGFGAINAVAKHQDLFAAALPLCGFWDTEKIQQLSQTPIWLIHGSEDAIISPEYSRVIYEAAQAEGLGNIRYTELENLGHNVWSRTYNNRAIWDWVFSQRK